MKNRTYMLGLLLVALVLSFTSFAATNRVPHIDLEPIINARVNVETFWATHPMNPQSPNHYGEVVSPAPYIDLSPGGDIASAAYSLPSGGGTIRLAAGTYAGWGYITGKSHVHIIAPGGQATINAYNRTGFRKTSMAYADISSCLQARTCTDIVYDRPENFYMENLKFDCQQSPDGRGGTDCKQVRDLIFENCEWVNSTRATAFEAAPANSDHLVDNMWFMNCYMNDRYGSGSTQAGNWAIFIDGSFGCGFINNTSPQWHYSGFLKNGQNDDMTADLNGDGIYQDYECRDSKYVFCIGNTFNEDLTYGDMFESVLGSSWYIKDNVMQSDIRSAIISGYKSSFFRWKGSTSKRNNYAASAGYHGKFNHVIGNTVKDVYALYLVDEPVIPFTTPWATTGQWVVRCNVVTAPHIQTSGEFISPNVLYNRVTSKTPFQGPYVDEGNCINDPGCTPCNTDTNAPTVPTGLYATATNSTSIALAWTASTDDNAVVGYRIYRGGSQVGTSATTTYLDSGLTPNTLYEYRVSAYDASANTSGWSSAYSVTTAAPDTQAPTMPTGLNGSANGSSQVSLSWNASTDNEGVAGYAILRDGSQIGTASDVLYNDTGLSPLTTYSYAVCAYDLSGNRSSTTTPVNVQTDESDNLLTNGSFEAGSTMPSDWSASGGAGGTRANDYAYNESYSLKVTGDQPSDGYFDQAYVLDPNTAYTLSMWVRQDGVSGNGVRVRYVETSPSVIQYLTPQKTGTHDWEQVSITFTTSASIAAGRVDIMVGEQDGGTTWIDMVDLRPGSGAAPTVATPSISPNGGTYTGSVQVTLSCGTSGAEIRYTTNGDTPTSGSALYSAPFSLTSSGTVKARGFKAGMTDSGIASASFTIAVPDSEDPTTPTALAVTATTDDSVSLSWSASTDNVGVTGYKVYRNGSQVGTSAGTSYTDTSLIPSMQYTYTVSAYDAAANDSAQSAPVVTSTKKDDGSGGAAPNLLTNPSFEDGTTVPSAWSQSGGAAGTRASDQAEDQTYAMKVEGDQAGDAYFDQTIALDPSTGYTLSFWLRQDGVTGSGVRARYVEIDPSVIQYLTPELTGTRGWEQVSLSFTTSASIVNGRVDILVGGMDAGTSWIDNVYLGTGSGGGGASDSDGDGIADSWENAMFGNLTTAGADTDNDGDGMTDLHEYIAATQPTNALSLLQLEMPELIVGNDTKVKWQSVPGRVYTLERANSLTSSFVSVMSDVTAADSLRSVTVNVDTARAYFRVKVQE